jgi:hypothetical protein
VEPGFSVRLGGFGFRFGATGPGVTGDFVNPAALVVLHHVDAAIRAVVGAEAAADAMVINLDFECPAFPVNRIDGATGEAVRVVAAPAGDGDKEVPESRSIADHAGDSAV